MKKTVMTLALGTVVSASAFAGSSYVTGNVQFHSDDIHGAKQTSTLEAGHTFSTGTTLLVEYDGIPVGKRTGLEPVAPYVTLGAEHMHSVNDSFWVAAGYHHLVSEGESVQYRPLIKLGYNFDNGVSISNRTRFHFDANDGNDHTQTRFDNAIGYQLSDAALHLRYNNVFVANDDADNTMDHEVRATWTRQGVQPYFEFRNQADNENNAFVFGASYGF